MKRTILLLFLMAATMLSMAKVIEIPGKNFVDVGISKVDITPEVPMRLSGYGSRTEVYDSVGQKLWAKAMVMGSDEEAPVVMISMDLVGFTAAMAERLSKKLAETAGLPRENIAFMATHTHSGPEAGALVNIFGNHMSGEHIGQIVAYIDLLEKKLEQLVWDALNNRQPSLVYTGKGAVGFAMNRRVLKDGKWTGFGETPDGPVEHDLPLIHVTDGKGKTRAMLINYACHGTTLTGEHNFVHGDWMGSTQVNLEKLYPGAIALISIGCGADSNPTPRGKTEHVEAHAGEVTREVERLIQKTKLREITRVPKTGFEYITLTFDKVPDHQEFIVQARENNAAGLYARNSLETIARGGSIPATYEYPIQVFSFGGELTMVFMGGEVVVDYVHRLKKELNNQDLWVNAYANDVTCYVASQRMYDEGGYEVDGSMWYYNKPSRFVKETENTIISRILMLHEKVTK
ncbi:MAG: neutral/alkaline non-lysosomal ceramidase N-terminal domain-containing protein [Cyclobacteriaceae bacterium]|nr:neutral/alkaline non-lysosomal ceramidase N-terminal domain-containing protein [Cyclobacteriaceae bacterium]